MFLKIFDQMTAHCKKVATFLQWAKKQSLTRRANTSATPCPPFRFKHLINQPVLDVDPARTEAGKIAEQNDWVVP